jgi:putative redox protein
MNTIFAKFFSGKMKHELRAGKHVIYSDVDEAGGGENLAPSPHDLLMMSLASCTAMTVRMYAFRKNWALKDVEVKIDLLKTESTTTFKRQIKFLGVLDDIQRERLLEIANRCPIHKVLTGKIEINTELLKD